MKKKALERKKIKFQISTDKESEQSDQNTEISSDPIVWQIIQAGSGPEISTFCNIINPIPATLFYAILYCV